MSLEDLSIEARDELAQLARTLAENPETRKDFLRLTKKAKPGLPIPELEIEDYTNTAVSSANKRVEHLEAKLRERDAMEELERRRSSVVRKGLANENNIEEIEKVMLEKGITNHESAAEYWAWMKQSAEPTPSGYNPSAISQFDLKKFWKNPVTGARDEAAKALADLRKGNRPIGF
jgi:hypothetical protein